MKRYQKNLLVSTAAILIIIGGIQIYVNFFLDTQLKQEVISRFNKATDDSYSLSIGTFKVKIFARQLHGLNINLTKKANTGTSINATIDEFTISGIGFWSLLWNRQLHIERIDLQKPEIYITESSPSSRANNSSRQLINWSKKISRISLQIFENVTVPTLVIDNLSVDYNRADLPVNPYFAFRDADIRLQNISIDSTLINDRRIIPSESISATIRNIQFQTANKLYKLTAEEIDFDSDQARLRLTSLKLIPKLEKREFALQVGHETDRISLNIETIFAQKINAHKLNKGDGLEAKHISIQKPDLDIFRDKHLPFPANNNPPLPQQVIANIPFATAIDSITISDGNIRYSELQLQSDRPGVVRFNNLQASILNLTNIRKRWTSDRPLILDTKTDIMDRAELTVHFTFPMNSEQHDVKGSLNAMEMHHLNEALEPLAFVRIDDGKINSMFFNMSLGPTKSSGSVELQYEDLNISVLNKGANKENFGSRLTSMLANTFKIKSNNTGNDLRIGTVSYERDNQKSVFNYWWKSLLSGLESSIGL